MAIMDWFYMEISERERYLAKQVVEARPSSLRSLDQIPMIEEFIIKQTKLMANELANKRVIFLGDADGMNLMFGLFGIHSLTPLPNHMLVLDIDDRIIKWVKQFSKENGFSSLITAERYNIKWKIPEKYKNWADCFYINPPYSSNTKPIGKAAIIFIDRCLDMCAPRCSGIILHPHDREISWTEEFIRNVEKYLIDVGCYIREKILNMHLYYLDDFPNLRSGTMIIDRLENKKTKYQGKEIPEKDLYRFYNKKNDPDLSKLEYVDENGNFIYEQKKYEESISQF